MSCCNVSWYTCISPGILRLLSCTQSEWRWVKVSIVTNHFNYAKFGTVIYLEEDIKRFLSKIFLVYVGVHTLIFHCTAVLVMIRALPIVKKTNLYADFFSGLPFNYYDFLRVSSVPLILSVRRYLSGAMLSENIMVLSLYSTFWSLSESLERVPFPSVTRPCASDLLLIFIHHCFNELVIYA